jgi:hypothetical protein
MARETPGIGVPDLGRRGEGWRSEEEKQCRASEITRKRSRDGKIIGDSGSK